MTKDEVVKILNDNSQKSVIGWAIEEDDFNEVAEKIVKLCNLQNVSNQRELLIAYGEWIHELAGCKDTEKATTLADSYLSNL